MYICFVSGLGEELKHRGEQHEIEWKNKKFSDLDLEGVDLVFTAVDDELASEAIVVQCREKRIPVNAADIPHLCDFWCMSSFRCVFPNCVDYNTISSCSFCVDVLMVALVPSKLQFLPMGTPHELQVSCDVKFRSQFLLLHLKLSRIFLP